MSARVAGAVLVVGLVALAGCAGGTSDQAVGAFRDPLVGGEAVRLVAYESCDEAAAQLRAATRSQIGPWGLDGGGSGWSGRGPDAVEDLAGNDGVQPAPAAPAAPAEAGAGNRAAPESGHSGTNVHEAGVDEPDLVKTDGRRIVTVSQGTLRVVDAARRVETGALDLFPAGAVGVDEAVRWMVADLLLYGDQALVLVQGSWYATGDLPQTRPGGTDPAPPPVTGPQLLLVDLAGPPRIASEYTIDGSLVDARAVGSTVRVVVRSGPRLALPQLDPELDDAERVAAYQAAVDEADLTDWLPRYELTDGAVTSTGQVDCTAVSRPASYSGTSLLTVLTFDLATPALGDGSPVSVVADGETVYSNGPSLYVAVPDPERDSTAVHKFDTSQSGAPAYVASGGVDGWLINQYAMSEWDGYLRVATTSGETAFGQESDSESAVYVLAQRDGSLAEVGSVGGLGKGERIYSVRFTGPVGYVVTFRETDPLYTVDLSDPTAPAVLGELKITGYSAYLHPVGAGRLLGVGQEADLQGVIQGTQVSLFNVADLSDPRLQTQHHVPHGHSEAEFDPHAFLWWPDERLLVIPLVSHGHGVEPAALVLRADDAGFTELARITHPAASGWENQIRRSLVAQGSLWTVSDAGLAAHALPTLTEVAWLPFA